MDAALLIVLFIVLYFLPSIIAGGRSHTSAAGILVVNFFLGWTFIGWVGALAWSVSGK